MLFLNMDFYFTYNANFNFAHFGIEKCFVLIWVKYKMVDFTCNFHFGYLKGARLRYGLYCIKKVKIENLGKYYRMIH